MGTFTDNLLKLTEFPFSYFFISLLLLVSYGESFLNQPIESLDPLLILMGFVATTLSMTDPIGGIQKIWLKALKAEDVKKMPKRFLKEFEELEKKKLSKCRGNEESDPK
jgi:hypothetical protein